MIENVLRKDMARLFKADPELEIIQVNFIVRRINEKAENTALLTYNYSG